MENYKMNSKNKFICGSFSDNICTFHFILKLTLLQKIIK